MFTPRRMFCFLRSKLVQIWIFSHSFTSHGFAVRRNDAFDINVYKMIQFLYYFRAAIIRSFHFLWLFIFQCLCFIFVLSSFCWFLWKAHFFEWQSFHYLSTKFKWRDLSKLVFNVGGKRWCFCNSMMIS